MSFPSFDVFEKYAQILVNFALHGGNGARPGEVIECIFTEEAKPLAQAIHQQILRSGNHPLMQMIPTGFEEDFYRLGQDSHFTFFPEEYHRARANLINHQIIIMDPTQTQFPVELLEKRSLYRSSQQPLAEWLKIKEAQGEYSYTLAIWPSAKAAAIVGLSMDEYWQELIRACQLDSSDPLAAWQTTFFQLRRTCHDLNLLKIKALHVEGSDVNLNLEVGPRRRWLGGRGRNLPTYEVFTSPDFRTVNGWLKCNVTSFKQGHVIEQPEFEFVDGVLVNSTASAGADKLAAFLKIPGMQGVAEFSLTDRRLSPINHPMGVTLFDENMGGEWGNFHIALGNSYRDALSIGDEEPASVPKTEAEWEALGFNSSKLHLDFISTSDRVVTATLENGVKKIIYQNGEFSL